MQVFSTQALRPQDRLAWWNDVAGESLQRMTITPLDPGTFHGQLCFDAIGDVGVGTAASSRSILCRSRELISRSTQRVFSVHLALHGSFTVTQGHSQGLVGEGDFTITDSTEPFSFAHLSDCKAAVLRFPEGLFKRYLPTVEQLGGCAVSGRFGPGALAADAIRSVARQLELDRCRDIEPESMEHVTALIAGACAAQFGVRTHGSGIAGWRRLAVRRYIESRLADPELNALAVAQQFRVSDRYLRVLFADEPEGVAAYILKRRLEECAKRLADPHWRGRSVSEIAFAWGFNSLASFDRAFKRHYGCTPQEHRLAKVTDPT